MTVSLWGVGGAFFVTVFLVACGNGLNTTVFSFFLSFVGLELCFLLFAKAMLVG
jgi:hypothetical protein